MKIGQVAFSGKNNSKPFVIPHNLRIHLLRKRTEMVNKAIFNIRWKILLISV